MGSTGFDQLCQSLQFSTERQLYKTKVNLINVKDTKQIEANMTVVHNILNENVSVVNNKGTLVESEMLIAA